MLFKIKLYGKDPEVFDLEEINFIKDYSVNAETVVEAFTSARSLIGSDGYQIYGGLVNKNEPNVIDVYTKLVPRSV